MTGIFFVKQKTAYEMRISDWSSDVCSSDLGAGGGLSRLLAGKRRRRGGRRVAGVGRGSPGEALGAEWTDGIDRPAIGARKRVVSGRGVSVRVGPGGRRYIKKKKINSGSEPQSITVHDSRAL